MKQQQQQDKSSAVNLVVGAGAGRSHGFQQRQQQSVPERRSGSLQQAYDDEEEKAEEEGPRPGVFYVRTSKSVPPCSKRHQQISPKAWRLSSGFRPSAAQSPEDEGGISAFETLSDPSAIYDVRLPGEKAAKVMREYLLPMLERHRLKQGEIQRRKRLGSPSSRKEHENEATSPSPASPLCSSPAKGSILSELQLSDALLTELETSKQHNASLQRRLDASEAAKDEAEAQLEACTSSLNKLTIELEHTRQKESFSRLHITQTENDCASLRWQLQQLESLISQHHAEQGRLTHQVTTLQKTNEDLRRKLAVTRNSAAVMRHEHEVITEQLRGLSGSAKELPTVKKLQDDILYEQLVSKAQLGDVQKFSRNLQNECAKLAEERVRLLDVKKDLTIQRDRLGEESTRLGKELEEARQHVLQETTKRNEELETLKKERESMEKHIKELIEDRDKFKQRIARFRARRRLFEAEQRTCKNCGNDYEESENYNWSCRTHHSGYGGEMWWCCGRLGKNAPGCRFKKHESRDDEDELEEEKQEREAAVQKLRNQSVTCLCCKATGHPASQCPKDPNPRAGAADVNPKDELRRLEILGNQERSQQRRKCGTAMALELAEKFGLEVLRSPPEDEDIFADLRPTSSTHQYVVDLNPTEEGQPVPDLEDVLPNTVPENKPALISAE